MRKEAYIKLAPEEVCTPNEEVYVKLVPEEVCTPHEEAYIELVPEEVFSVLLLVKRERDGHLAGGDHVDGERVFRKHLEYLFQETSNNNNKNQHGNVGKKTGQKNGNAHTV